MIDRRAGIRFLLATLLFSVSAIPLCSLGPGRDPVPMKRSEASFRVTGYPQRIGDRIVFNSDAYCLELNIKDLSCLTRDRSSTAFTVVSKAAFASSAFRISEDLTELSYPRLGITVKLRFETWMFALEFSSRKPQSITWPSFDMAKEGTALIWPHFEGNYIPLDDSIWTGYLSSRKWDTTQSQYLPFWGVERGKRLLSYLVENPFHNSISFSESRKAVALECTHRFPDNGDLAKPIAFRVYFDRDASPITPAKHFRRYLIDNGLHVTLKEKMKIAPPIARMIGAPHAYVWDGQPITKADIKFEGWIPLAQTIAAQAAAEHPSTGRQIMLALSPERGNFEEMSRQARPAAYLQDGMARYLSEALRSSALYSESLWPLPSLPPRYRDIAQRILAGSKNPEYQLVQLNSYLLHSSFPEYLNSPDTWGNGVSTRMIDALAESGMNRFVLTCNGIENLDIRPNIAAKAADEGFLIGPYDSYFEIQDPDAPEWPTAIFDRALYETGGIVRADGTPVKGFLGIGYYASPIAMKPYFEERIEENFRRVPHSYYFLDCDAYGECFDDYRPGRIVGASEDVAARLDRVRGIFEEYHVPVGSEGGSYLFAPSLTVAEGVFTPTMGIFDDPDFEIVETSRYYLGRSLPLDEPERFFQSSVLKDEYVRLLVDPRFRLPLYEAALHDSVITTSHYSSPSLKFSNTAETTALTEILYQVAPMYHFTLGRFEEIKATIKPHVEVFERTHSYSYQYALEDFEYLADDRNVQRTRFGELEMIANFRETDFDSASGKVPARSVLIAFKDSGEVFVYHDSALSGEAEEFRDIPRLIAALTSAEWKERERAAIDISRIGAPAKASIPTLIAALADAEWQVRAAAAKALANMEGEAATAVPGLIEALRDEEWQVRKSAAYALASVGGKARAAVPSLAAALDDEEWMMRRAAAWALASIGPAARRAVPALKAKLQDPEMQVRVIAEMALERMR